MKFPIKMLNYDFGLKAIAPQDTYYSKTFDLCILPSETSHNCLYPIIITL